MQGEVSMKQSRFGLAVIVALIGALAALALAGPAGAIHTKNPSRNDQYDPPIFANGDVYQGFDPMEASAPYVAWRGEEIRLVKCFDPAYFTPRSSGDPDEGGIPIVAIEADETGEWGVMDWSGDPHVWPQFFDDNDKQTRVFFPGYGDQRGRGCFAIDITSHKPGVAIVKLKIDDGRPSPGGVGNAIPGEGDPRAVHQFNVIWLEFDEARLRCLESRGTAPTVPSGCPGAGPVITENLGDTNRLGVVVQGRAPLNEQFTRELGGQNSAFSDGVLTFPEEYPALSETSLAHVSLALQRANDGVEGNDNFNNPTCDDSPDTGSLASPSATACVNDVGDADYVPEPDYQERGGFFAAGNFWDIHDSTGPYNTTVYGPGKPLVPDICPVPPTGVPATHNVDCHVDQFVDASALGAGGGGDLSCDNGEPDGAGGDEDGNDTVDNCDPGEFSSFSRVFHDVSGEDDVNEPTIGPYSPTRPDETLLSDSTVNAHDAPMPAALVIGYIVGDADTIGFLEAVDKHRVYNRNGTSCTGTLDQEHCVTNPFSGAYIPPSPTMENNPAQNIVGTADDDPDTASGIHGSIANNFNGYLPVSYRNNSGTYHFWDIVHRGDVLVGRPNGCPNPANGQFLTPSGLQELWLYTDEHGEAQFQFNSGAGFFFDPADTPGVEDPFRNAQGGCVPVGQLGTAEIRVNTRYPFQPLTAVGPQSNEIQKRVLSRFRKGIVCIPKPGEGDTKALCVIFARNVDGTPLNEDVCVSVTGTNNVAVRDFEPDPAPTAEAKCRGVGLLGVDTDDIGLPSTLSPEIRAAVLAVAPFIDSSFGTETILIVGLGSHLVTADFVDERIEIQVNLTIPSTTGTVAGTSTNPAPQPPGAVILPGGAVINQIGTGVRPTATVTSTIGDNKPAVKPTKAKKRASLAFVRIQSRLKFGLNARFVLLRVKSSLKSEIVQIKLIGKRGKVLGTVLRKVKTNRTVRVANLRLPKAAVTVRVKVILTA
jgi:hypothetical protein